MTRLPTLPVPHALAGALCLGLAGSLAVRAPGAPAIVVAATLAAIATVAAPARAPVLMLALAAAGWWWGSGRLTALDASPLSAEIGTSTPLRLEVTGPGRLGEFAQRLPVRVRAVREREIDEAAQLELPVEAPTPPQGAILELVARVRAPREADAAGGFDEAAYLRRHGMHVVLRAERFDVVGRRGGLGGVADQVRSFLAGSIAPGLAGERRALVAGVVLGEDEGLDAELLDRFRASGLYHLLAVSGQNVAYVVAGMLVLAWLAGVPRAAALACALVAILAYVLAVGWQPSVVRAGVAGGLACLAWLSARAGDRWYFMLVGGAVLLAWNPYALFDPGFQLSFAAVAAIFVLVPRMERWLEGYPVPRVVVALVAVSTACAAVTAPILWIHFCAVPLLSVLANALAAPVVGPILGLGLLAAAVQPVLPGAALALGWVNGWLVAYLAWCARLVGGLPFAQLSSPGALAAIAGVPAFLLAVRRFSPRWRRSVLVGAAALALVLAAWVLWPRTHGAGPPAAGLRVSFLDVGQGDAVLLEVPEGAVLVDQGPPEARVARILRRRGVPRLALLVLTHPQRDHIGGAAEVMRALQVETVLDPRLPAESVYEDDALEAASDRGVPVLTARAGQAFQLGRLRLQVLWPEGPGLAGEDPNEHAIVLLASYGEVDALLTADAESNVTSRLRIPPVEILKVAHHGSSDPGLPALLERLRPRVAVVSVGAGNDYGHPAPSTLGALADAPGLRTHRTDLDGTVVVESDGSHLGVRSER